MNAKKHKQTDSKGKTPGTTGEIKPEKNVLREPGQISFKDALTKAILPGKKINRLTKNDRIRND